MIVEAVRVIVRRGCESDYRGREIVCRGRESACRGRKSASIFGK